MFLAEAIKEKDYIKKSIDRLHNRILWLSVTTSESDSKLNSELINNKLEELEKLYKEYQKYSIITQRAKGAVKIKLNDGEFSIADAESLIQVLKNKLECFQSLIEKVEGSNTDPSNIVCLNIKDIDIKTDMLEKDIKTIRLSVDKSLWGFEI